MSTRFDPSSAGLAFDHLIVQRASWSFFLREPGRLGRPRGRDAPRLQIGLLGFGVALLGRRHHRRIDDLPAYREIAGLTHCRFVGRKQDLDHGAAVDLRAGQRLAERPDRVGVRHRIGQPQPEEPHER